MFLHSSSVRPAELTRNPRSHKVRENSDISGRNSCSAFSLPKRNNRSRSEYGNNISRPYPPSASKLIPCAGVLRTRSNSPNTFLMVLSASSHNCRNVSRAPAPLSNSFRIRSRWASHWGPSSESGVTCFSSIFLLCGRKLGTRPGRVEDIGILTMRFRRVPRCGSGSLHPSGSGISYRLRFFLSWRS